MKPRRRHPVRSISRSEAAQLLRIARNAWRSDPSNAGEAIGWASTVLRDSHQARRLKIDHLLAMHNFDSADALLARCMMTDADRPLLRWRFAASMFAQGRIDTAFDEIEAVLASRPNHCGALALGAKIALAQGNPQRAADLLTRAASLRPRDVVIRGWLVRALLANDRINDASEILERWPAAPRELCALAHRARGRLLDAIESLEPACHEALSAADTTGAERERLGTLLLELLSELGAVERLIEWTLRLGQLGCRAALIGCRSLLAVGRFEQAQAALDALTDHLAMRSETLPEQVVALALMGDYESAREMLQQAPPLDPKQRQAWAECWLQSWTGRIIADNKDARVSGSDPSTSVLQPLLANAANVLQHAIDTGTASRDDDQQRVRELLAACFHAMGQPELAGAAFASESHLRQHLLTA